MGIIPENFFPVQIAHIKQETNDVKTFTLSKNMHYKAGQFITLLHPHYHERRSYSFSSAPATDNLPSVTVKRIGNGMMSRYLYDQVMPGDELFISGPSGFFTVPANIDSYEQVLFLAGGIGITPVISLIKTLLHDHDHLQVTLFYSSRSATDTVFYNELLHLQFIYADRFKIHFLFSSSQNLERARLSKWLLPSLLREYLSTSINKVVFYTCGPFSYMRMVLLTLEEEGIPAANIKKENFNVAPGTPRRIPPDTHAYDAVILNNGKRSVVRVQYPDTILAAAQKQGLHLPYSCGNGICGTCAAKCVSGHVWHRNNEVLTEEDLASGLTLTCTGFPVYGDIILEIK